MGEDGEIVPLDAWDYVVFAAMLLASTAIGFYYAFSGGRQKTQGEFLMANKSMGVAPVTLSLLASFMSAITLLGTPATMYLYGTQYWMIGPSYIVVCAVAAHVFLPIFYRLQITSVYEYLELRFSRAVRLLGCFTFLIQMGGMKAVMWTDVLQITIMFAGMITVGAVGTSKLGGFNRVWELYGSTGRLQLWNFNPDPTDRHTVWSLAVGGIFTWLVIYGVNQSQVQRYLTVPTLRQAQLAIWLNLPGLWGLLTVCAFTGIVAFAYYFEKGCDPLHSEEYIQKSDQILPLFVMEVLAYPGFRGLFVATIFSGALSTISSGVNALAAVTLEDLVKPIWIHFRKTDMSDETGAKLAKGIAVGFGVLSLVLAFVASKMGDVLAAALGLFGIVGGPVLGVFTLGVLFPCANWQGAVAGHLFGEFMSLWIGVGSFIYKPPVEHFPYNNTLCPYPHNETVTPLNVTVPAPYQGLPIYKISYMWQGAWAVLWTMVAGLVVSAFTGWQPKSQRNPAHVFPVLENLCCCLPQSLRSYFQDSEIPKLKEESGAKEIPYGLPSESSLASSQPSDPAVPIAYTNLSFKPDSSADLVRRIPATTAV